MLSTPERNERSDEIGAWDTTAAAPNRKPPTACAFALTIGEITAPITKATQCAERRIRNTPGLRCCS
jgi:hypothetical protein